VHPLVSKIWGEGDRFEGGRNVLRYWERFTTGAGFKGGQRAQLDKVAHLQRVM